MCPFSYRGDDGGAMDTVKSAPDGSQIQQKGFSLLEILIALAVLGLVLGGLLSLNRNVLHGAGGSERTAVAAVLAQGEAERYRSILRDPNQFDVLAELAKNTGGYVDSEEDKTQKGVNFRLRNEIRPTSMGGNTVIVNSRVAWIRPGTETDSQFINLRNLVRRRD